MPCSSTVHDWCQVETLKSALYVAAEERAIAEMGLSGFSGEEFDDRLEDAARSAQQEAQALGVIDEEGQVSGEVEEADWGQGQEEQTVRSRKAKPKLVIGEDGSATRKY